jgi:predicted transposase YbfD/YdcC
MTQDEGWRELHRHSLRVDDPRSDHGKRHKLSEVLFLTVVGLLAGAQNAEDLAYVGHAHLEWFRRFLVLEHGVPSRDTFLAVLALVKADEIECLVRTWTTALREPGALTTEGNHVAFDGQALRGSADRDKGTTAVQMVSAYLTAMGVTLGTERVDDKSNEIKAIPNLIRSLNLRGATVTIDAMGCQRDIAAELRAAGAHYVLQVKENQPTLLANAKTSGAELARRRKPGEAPAQMDRHREVDKGHGRLETRTCIITHDISAIERAADWADLAGIAIMLREREDVISGKKSREISYFILSDAAASAAQVATIIRNHWAIENKLHWSMDVVWGSDAHCVRDRTAAENFARMRRFCDGLIKQSTGWGMSGRRVRLGIGWNPDNALRVLAGEVIARARTRRLNRKDVGRFGQGVAKAKK